MEGIENKEELNKEDEKQSQENQTTESTRTIWKPYKQVNEQKLEKKDSKRNNPLIGSRTNNFVQSNNT